MSFGLDRKKDEFRFDQGDVIKPIAPQELQHSAELALSRL